jgi:hypothetical protein
MRLCHLLVVLVDDLGGYTFHAEDFNLEALAAWIGVFDMCEVFLVDLVHVHRETWELLVQCSKDLICSCEELQRCRDMRVTCLLRYSTAFHSGRI